MQHKLTAEQVTDITNVNPDILKPGTLVVYHGGGYDGCFWEYNCFLVTDVDEIVDIHSSGTAGVWNRGFAWGGSRKPEFDFDNLIRAVYEPSMAADLNTKEGRREINGFIGCYALAVARKLEELDLGFSVELKCCECGEYFDCTEEFLLDHGYDRGDGGIGIVNDHLVCSSCYYSTICTGCDERYEEGEELSTDKGSYCEWCVNQVRKKFSEEEEELYERLETDILQITIDSRRLGELRPENKEVYAKQANELIWKLQVEMAKMVEEYL
jgi:hypothetical protein